MLRVMVLLIATESRNDEAMEWAESLGGVGG